MWVHVPNYTLDLTTHRHKSYFHPSYIFCSIKMKNHTLKCMCFVFRRDHIGCVSCKYICSVRLLELLMAKSTVAKMQCLLSCWLSAICDYQSSVIQVFCLDYHDDCSVCYYRPTSPIVCAMPWPCYSVWPPTQRHARLSYKVHTFFMGYHLRSTTVSRLACACIAS